MRNKHLLIATDFPPVRWGEANYLYHLYRYLPADEVVVLAPKMPGDDGADTNFPLKVKRAGFLLPSKFPGKILRIISMFIHSLILIRREKITCIHCGQALVSGPLGCFLEKVFGIPYYLYFYGGELERCQKANLPFRWLKLITRYAQGIIVISDYVRDKLEKLGVEEGKIFKVTPGVDTERFNPELDKNKIREKYRLQGKKIILTAARLDEGKGIDTVIDYLPGLLKDFPNLVYLVVGQGPQMRYLERLKKKYRLEKQVIFAGWVADKELPFYYAACDLFVMPRREIKKIVSVEGFGIVFLEASACGKPVLGTFCGGISEAVENGVSGILVNPGEKEAIYKALVSLLSNQALAEKLGKEGRIRAETNFTWEQKAARLKKILLSEQSVNKKIVSEQCILCNAEEAHFIFPHFGKSLIRCVQCGLVSTYPKLSEEEEYRRYIEKDYDLESRELYQHSRERIFKEGLNLIERFRQDEGKLLDIGCNAGHFLEKARNRGWKTFGVEPSRAACQRAREKFSLDVFNGRLNEAEFPDGYFDVATLWMVLDQFSRPLAEMKEIYRVLKPGGIVLARIPNVTFHLGLFYLHNSFNLFFSKILKIKEPAVFHRYAFSKKTARRLFAQAGFEEIKIYNAKPSQGDIYGALKPFYPKAVTGIKKIFFFAAQIIFYISNRRLLISSSLLVAARK